MSAPLKALRLALAAALVASTASLGAPAEKGTKAGGVQDGTDDPAYVVRSSTKIDFNETNIDGKMKAPEGFYLQGRRAQKMQNLLRLRQDFKKELEGSSEAAQTEYK
jgi:hypothetical protein